VESKVQPAFAVWVTGLPASGKSTVARFVKAQLAERGMRVAVLESDALRPILTPHPTYSEPERDDFYQRIADLGALLVQQGIPVIFDATANRRAHRDRARQLIPRFLEMYVRCPLEVCMARDPKGIYRRAAQQATGTVPGLQSSYEPPEAPDLITDCDQEPPEEAARRLVALLAARDFLRI
jgi:adenylylsulfate kinase